MGLKWAKTFCPKANFIMKTDDDIFVNLKRLHRALTTEEIFVSNIVGKTFFLSLQRRG